MLMFIVFYNLNFLAFQIKQNVRTGIVKQLSWPRFYCLQRPSALRRPFPSNQL